MKSPGLGKELGYCHAGLEPPTGIEIYMLRLDLPSRVRKEDGSDPAGLEPPLFKKIELGSGVICTLSTKQGLIPSTQKLLGTF